MKKEKIIEVKLQKDYKLVKPRKQKRKRKALMYAEEPTIGEHGRTQGYWVALIQEKSGGFLVAWGDERGHLASYSTDDKDSAIAKYHHWRVDLKIEEE